MFTYYVCIYVYIYILDCRRYANELKQCVNKGYKVIHRIIHKNSSKPDTAPKDTPTQKTNNNDNNEDSKNNTNQNANMDALNSCNNIPKTVQVTNKGTADEERVRDYSFDEYYDHMYRRDRQDKRDRLYRQSKRRRYSCPSRSRSRNDNHDVSTSNKRKQKSRSPSVEVIERNDNSNTTTHNNTGNHSSSPIELDNECTPIYINESDSPIELMSDNSDIELLDNNMDNNIHNSNISDESDRNLISDEDEFSDLPLIIQESEVIIERNNNKTGTNIDPKMDTNCIIPKINICNIQFRWYNNKIGTTQELLNVSNPNPSTKPKHIPKKDNDNSIIFKIEEIKDTGTHTKGEWIPMFKAKFSKDIDVNLSNRDFLLHQTKQINFNTHEFKKEYMNIEIELHKYQERTEKEVDKCINFLWMKSTKHRDPIFANENGIFIVKKIRKEWEPKKISIFFFGNLKIR